MAGSILSIFDHTKIATCMGVSLAEAERFIDAVCYSGPSDEEDADRAQRLIDGVNEVIGGKAPAAVAAKVRGQLAREIALRGDAVAPVAPPMGVSEVGAPGRLNTPQYGGQPPAAVEAQHAMGRAAQALGPAQQDEVTGAVRQPDGTTIVSRRAPEPVQTVDRQAAREAAERGEREPPLAPTNELPKPVERDTPKRK